ncbi:MAG: adenylate/guanylate cyclase domain-containing protein, partial [Leptolyngbyaceae cyanobacterium bins.302]|nr:adenylate/guanylate cyclase domain-containing protein [Leptolyngbyaceae cyanobacterium bins.302]
TGDGLIMCFNSAEKAVSCAVQIQSQFIENERKLDAKDVLRHRIGIHLGEITFTSNDVMGSGVNIAARLQGQAPSGGICISQTVYDVIKSNLALSIKAIGEKQLKGIKAPMALYHIDLPEEVVAKIDQEDQERTKSAKQKNSSVKQDPELARSSGRSLSKLLLASLITTGLITTLRYLGVLQPLELWAFNQMMQLRPTESLDKRIIVITIDDDDRRIYGDNPL